MTPSTNDYVFRNLLLIQLEQAAHRIALVLLPISINFALALIPMP